MRAFILWFMILVSVLLPGCDIDRMHTVMIPYRERFRIAWNEGNVVKYATLPRVWGDREYSTYVYSYKELVFTGEGVASVERRVVFVEIMPDDQ